jgi:hypothetical protein
MAERVKWGAPRRLNAVSITLIVLCLAAAYWLWTFFPAYFNAWTVDHTLKETAAAVYRANLLREPERSTELRALLQKARGEIVHKAGVTDPKLKVNLEITGTSAKLTADYKVIVSHPFVSRKSTLEFHRSASANIKKVTWD